MSKLKIETPGEILKAEWLEPLALSQYRLARELGISEQRVSELINGRRSITLDTALRLGRLFGTSPELWLNLQADFDLRTAARSGLAKKIERAIKPLAEAT